MLSSSPAHTISDPYSITQLEHLPNSTAEATPLVPSKGAQCTDVYSAHAHSHYPKYNMNTLKGKELSHSADSHHSR